MNWPRTNRKIQSSSLEDSMLLDCNEHLHQEDAVKDDDMDTEGCEEPRSSDKGADAYFQKSVQLPFLPPLLPEDSPGFRKYTLVLDLDETLIHSSMVQHPSRSSREATIKFHKRPGLAQFLRGMSDHFEVIVFTAGGQEYADAVLDSLAECKDYISHRLYWDHVTMVKTGMEFG